MDKYITQLDEKSYLKHQQWMSRAIVLAQQAALAGDVPVGAVILDREGRLIAEASNRKERDQDPTAHAEILVLRRASQILKTWHLEACYLYVTLEPCPMCTGAIIQARIGLLVYGVDDPKTGTIRTVANLPDSSCSNHRLSVLSGIMESACREQLQTWFAQRR
ncbi:nucleoside deaminase [Gloeothece verrucosa]|uniref:tRNA-specific adenosine deaminase n=1 Tax=Gloeothece verrucosa (strain PCC 7822) TaxID=497965 RepID=E0UF61_GLOV7|nr:nucleoside deaminase [Gloeothece verrucosa]ADN14313.1 CMP/dCMP deaminase zinc-binding protein [Gloeothece verrucosa PCC 7822]